MFYHVKAYVKYQTRTQKLKEVQSDFIREFVSTCFYDKKKYAEYEDLKKYRKYLFNHEGTVDVVDFGAGSQVFDTNIREISKVAKTAGVSARNAELLFRIVRHLQPETILEIGTSLGLATSALSMGNPKAKLKTLEGCANTQSVPKEAFESDKTAFSSENVNFVTTEFSSYFESPEAIRESTDLIYFDGNHSKEATIAYFDALLPTVNDSTVWLFDDIHWSEGMEEAWEYIKSHASVTATIDAFQWGIVFFKRDLKEEHCIIDPQPLMISRVL